MNEALEGLDYGTLNKSHKYDHADKPESLLEKGKYDSARDPAYAKEHDMAEKLRMKDGGCCDPMYHNSKKNV